jgi:hypothetical protein
MSLRFLRKRKGQCSWSVLSDQRQTQKEVGETDRHVHFVDLMRKTFRGCQQEVM